jgi:predicted DsbA family dithiol-disulfide isomerase
VSWRGFELHPETPAGGVPLTRVFPAGRLEKMHAHLKGFAEEFGVKGMGQPGWLTNTRRVLAMAEYARDHGKLDAFRTAAMEAHWRGGKNLENEADLRQVAASVGLDVEAAMNAGTDAAFLARIDVIRHEASDKGVSGIPTFFIGKQVVVGCQPYEQLAAAAVRAGAARRV